MKKHLLLAICAGALVFFFYSTLSAQSSWTTSGNSPASPTEFLGTTNKTPICFKTFNQDRMYISSTGFVGIGTTTPVAQLDIKGGSVRIGELSGAGLRLMMVDSDGILIATKLTLPEVPDWNDGESCGLRLDGWGVCKPNLSELILSPNYSRVIIGDASNPFPAVTNMKLDVRGGMRAMDQIRLNDWTFNTPIDNSLSLVFQSNTRFHISSAGDVAINASPNPAAKFQIQAHAVNNAVAFCSQSNYASDFKYNTKTIINRDNTKAIAVVDERIGEDIFRVWGHGLVETKHIKVHRDSWADYVFAEDYELMSLDAVESYISTHGHLPGIPTTEEAVNEGIDLGEMQMKLLEKVEELTLYVIELEKKVELLTRNLENSGEGK